MEDQLPALSLVGAAIIVGLVQAIKGATNMPARYAPLLSVSLGMLLGMAYFLGGEVDSWLTAVVLGIVAGLSASGLYSGAKAMHQ